MFPSFRTLIIALTGLFAASIAHAEMRYTLGTTPLTAEQIRQGGIYVALHTENSLASKYLSSGASTSSFSTTTGANTFYVEAVDGGVTLKNILSGEYIGGVDGSIARTANAADAKVFTVPGITSVVENTTSNSLNGQYFRFVASNGSTYYLNTNCKSSDAVMYEGLQYAGGNGCWSVFFVYEVTVQDIPFIKLTPIPSDITYHSGTFTFPADYTVHVGTFADADDATTVLGDAGRFVTRLSATANANGTFIADASGATVTIAQDASLPTEGYTLDITADHIAITAATADGVYYAFQSIYQLLAPNVMAGTAYDAAYDYTMPCICINDAPRFGYRGFMLDVSRHFFTIEEVKKMLDLMALYKLNIFHWHLTDDQGWRAEIKKYPLLTTVGAQRSNSYNTDISLVYNYWWTGTGANTNQPYGPYFYTQDEMRDVVAYAAERHISILPEVDMPGHFVAAMASYPEYSCTPTGSHNVWTTGGISSDVLNVANADAVQFAKDILSELCDIFPYPYIHIGGDECPTSAWENNTDCQALYAELGLSTYRGLQTNFIKQISDFVKTKQKTLFCWNESISASGANTTIMKETGATIMCWNPCQSSALQAANLGLDCIVTEYHSSGGGYYINRRQSNDYGEPSGAGYGDDSVEGCYAYVPVPTGLTAEQESHFKGIQGTFWTEHVSSNEYLEYLAIPRLFCIAESAWSPQAKKSWDDFKSRITLDTEALDLGGYIYGRHWMDNYEHRTASSVNTETSLIGSTVTFTNYDNNRGRCLCDDNGTLNGQGSACTQFVIEAGPADEQYYIRSVESGLYLYASSTASGTEVTLSTNKLAWTFDTTTISGYVAICAADNTAVAINNNVYNTTHARLFAHGSGNYSTFWTLETVKDGSIVKGDANIDGRVSISDVTHTVRYIHRPANLKTDVTAADMNEDSNLDATDIPLIIEAILQP